jgi:hypothetical protein
MRRAAVNAAEAHLDRVVLGPAASTCQEAVDILRLLFGHKANAYAPATVPGQLSCCLDGRYRLTAITAEGMPEDASQQARRQTAVHIMIEAQILMTSLLRGAASQGDWRQQEAGMRQADASLFGVFKLLVIACPPTELQPNVTQAGPFYCPSMTSTHASSRTYSHATADGLHASTVLPALAVC